MNQPNRYLLNPYYLGDSVMLEPIARISGRIIICETPQLFMHHDHVDAVDNLPANWSKADMIDMGSVLGGFNLTDLYSHANIMPALEAPELFLSRMERTRSKNRRNGGLRVGVAPRSRHAFKEYPHFGLLVKWLLKEGHPVYNFDLTEKVEGAVNVVGLPIRDLMTWLASMDLLVSNDTGLAHIASALGVRTYVVGEEHCHGLYGVYDRTTVLVSSTGRFGQLSAEEVLVTTGLKRPAKLVKLLKRVVDIIVTRRALGDILLCYPVLKWLSAKYGIVLSTDEWLYRFMAKQEFLVSAVAYDRPHRYVAQKAAINLEETVDFIPVADRKHRTLLFQERISRQLDEEVELDHEYRWVYDNRIERFGLPDEYIVLAPKSKSSLREWNRERELAEKFPLTRFVLLHSEALEGFSGLDNVTDLSGKTNIDDLFAVCNGAVGGSVPDSGIMHIMGVLTQPTVAVFGNVIPPENRVSDYPRVMGLRTEVKIEKFDYGLYRQQPYCWHQCCYDGLTAVCSGTNHFRWCTQQVTPETAMEVLDGIH